MELCFYVTIASTSAPLRSRCAKLSLFLCMLQSKRSEFCGIWAASVALQHCSDISSTTIISVCLSTCSALT